VAHDPEGASRRAQARDKVIAELLQMGQQCSVKLDEQDESKRQSRTAPLNGPWQAVDDATLTAKLSEEPQAARCITINRSVSRASQTWTLLRMTVLLSVLLWI
ncbi:MAG: hypothetical protein ACKVP1_10000, partial [Burkholderiaceae bacterium]